MVNWLDGLEELLFQKSRTMDPPWGPVLRRLRYPVALIRDWLERRNQHSRDESGLHHTAVARAADGVRLVDPQGPRCAWRRENSTSRIFSPDGQRRHAADRERAAIRREHARRIARLDRPGVPRVHRGHDDSKDRDEFQLRLAGRAAAKRRAPLHRVPERHDLGPHPARGGPRPAGIRRTQSIRAVAAGHRAARVDHGRVGRHRCPMPSSPSYSPSCIRSFPIPSVRVSRCAHRRRDRRHHLGAGRQGIHRRASCIPRRWWRSTPALPSC